MVTVVKAGGAVLSDADFRERVATQVAALEGQVVFVHGGGPQLDEACAKTGLHTERKAGRRVTSPEVLELAVATWRGHGSVAWVQALARAGVSAVGLCGLDGGLLLAKRRAPTPIDYGAVGDLLEVRTGVLNALHQAGLVPVVSPLAATSEATLLNVNADTVAAHIAIALQADRLWLISGASGIRATASDPESVLGRVDLDELAKLRHAGQLQGGMLPKVAATEAALRGGVGEVRVGRTQVRLAA